ncbi:MAG: PaaI family thioesterase [Syntrophobacteraceae bacterium]
MSQRVFLQTRNCGESMLERSRFTPEYFNNRTPGSLPDYLGMVVTEIGAGEVEAEIVITGHHLAPNGFLHAGTIVTLADTACAIGCYAHLPEGAGGFTTAELKSNFLASVREGTLECSAHVTHRGKSTQVWDATVVHKESGRTIALFRCTQLIMYPKS